MIIDSGTSTTRVRAFDGQRVLAQAVRPVGARDNAVAGHTGPLRAALRELVAEVQATVGPAAGLIASGMITSENGLAEIPHLQAPAGAADLAAAMRPVRFPHIAPQPIWFIPGVKVVPQKADPAGADMMRGEETEVIGLLRLLGVRGPATFLHFGSHHKAVQTDGAGRIAGCVTTLGGELLAALSEATVLSGLLRSRLDREPDAEPWEAGAALAARRGLPRALFQARVAGRLLEHSDDWAAGFVLGALAVDGRELARRALAQGRALYLYGRPVFVRPLARWLNGAAEVVAPELVSLAVPMGAASIYTQREGISNGIQA